MSSSFQIIVLNTIKYKESGFIVNGYSDNRGRNSYFLKASSKKSRARPHSNFHPLAIVDITLSSFRLSNISTIKEFSIANKLSSIKSDIVKSSIALFMSDLIYNALIEQEHNPELYSFIKESIINLEKIERGVANFHLLFLYGIIKKLGYSPVKSTPSSSGMLFDIPTASFLQPGERGFHTFTREESEVLLFLEKCEVDRLSSLKLTGKERYNFIKTMISFLNYHSGLELKVKSLEILKEIFE